MNARTARAAASSDVPANQSRRRGPSAGAYIQGARIAPSDERAVDVVELLGRPPAVGEEQQPERDLGDEQRLREREQVRDQPADLRVRRQ